MLHLGDEVATGLGLRVTRCRSILLLIDLNHASRYASRLIVMNHGAVVADGPPADVITPELLGNVFRVEATIMTDPITGVPICVGHRAITDREPSPAATRSINLSYRHQSNHGSSHGRHIPYRQR